MPRRVERRETPERLGRAETRGGARARGRTAELVVPRSMPTTFSARMPMGIAARRPITARALSWRVLPWKALKGVVYDDALVGLLLYCVTVQYGRQYPRGLNANGEGDSDFLSHTRRVYSR